ncbi:MAG: 4-hydroxy-3-methylbut-2-enyl diphosphate reductase [Verrucomicrobiae bacterium]|nr:4-hydroxy-3-methylbut-2-enyl diphosphate reductase [Verrucomicrobiae bacterium]
MRIQKATHLGMCFGVRDAIALATREARHGPVTVLGQLVHNPAVIDHLRRHDVFTAESLADARPGPVVISAHGASDITRERLRQSGRPVLETTCPLVHHAHRALAKLVADGFHPVVVGKRGHVEVRGLTEDLPEYDIILSREEVHALRERPRYGVVAQTTQPVDRVLRLVEALRHRFPHSEVRFSDTVCRPTKDRQQAAIDLARRSTVMVVIGGANSNNTRELATSCARFCRRVHQIESAEELRPAWFRSNDLVGITAGTSTPDDVIGKVEGTLRGWAHHAGELKRACRQEESHAAIHAI